MSTPDSKTILIADPDPGSTRRLAAALRADGARVLSVRDGSRALELAVMRVPDLVLYDVGCPLIDSRTFSEILRANPRTAAIPLIIVGSDESSERARGGFREGFIQKPFNVDEVLSRIQQIFRRSEAADEVRREGALEGRLSEINLPDLLQIMAMNRRSGALRIGRRLDGLEEQGELVLRDGRVVDARVGEVRAEKAFYRLLAWKEGSFAFAPGRPTGPGTVTVSIDELLLEGMRRQDEQLALEGIAPGRDDVLALAVDRERLPDGLHPVTQEVLELVPHWRTCGQVLDHGRAPDLEMLRAMTALVERGLLKVLGRAAAEGGGRRLVGPEVAYALHGRHLARRPDARPALRIVLAAPDPADLRRVFTDLVGVEGWRPLSSAQAVRYGLGDLGSLRLTDSVSVALTALPADPSLSPVWRPFGAGALGAILLPGEGLEALVDSLLAEDRPVVVVGEGEALLERAGKLGLTAPTVTDALARLLERAARAQRTGG